MFPEHQDVRKVRHRSDVSIEEEERTWGGSLEALRGKQSERERGSDGRLKRRGVSEVNTMGAVISDGGHLIPRSQREAAGSDYCLLPVCCSTLPLTLREYSAHTVLKHELTKRWIKTSRKQLTPPVIDSKSSAEHLRWAALGSFRSHAHCQLDLACGKTEARRAHVYALAGCQSSSETKAYCMLILHILW